MNFSYLAQIAVNGLHMGVIYALLAWGYAVTHSVTHRANIAHGALFAFSGQVVGLATNFAYNTLWMTLPLALVFGGAAAAALSALVLTVMARTVFPRFVAHAPNMMIAATLAVSLVLMETARIGSGARDHWLPPLGAGRIPLGLSETAPTLTALQLINIAIMVAIIAAGELVLRRSQAGRRLRAVADDPLAASLTGTDATRIVDVAIHAGGLTAVAAGIMTVFYYGNMSFGTGLVFGLKVLFLSAAGGFSTPLRAAFGAFAFGEAEQFWDGYFPVQWREAVFYAALAAMLITRSSAGQQNTADALRL